MYLGHGGMGFIRMVRPGIWNCVVWICLGPDSPKSSGNLYCIRNRYLLGNIYQIRSDDGLRMLCSTKFVQNAKLLHALFAPPVLRACSLLPTVRKSPYA